MPVVSKEVVLNILHRSQDKEPATLVELPARLMLINEPVADGHRYEMLMDRRQHVAK